MPDFGALFGIAFAAILVNNILLSQFLGICSFLGLSGRRDASLSMGFAVLFVITSSAIVSWFIYNYALVPLEIEYLRTIIFILVISAFVQFIEMVIKKFSPALYQALGVYLPLITTNCAVLGVALTITDKNYDLLTSTVYAVAISIGYTVVIYIFATIREAIKDNPIEKHYQGIPIALISAFIMSMIFMGFAGMV